MAKTAIFLLAFLLSASSCLKKEESTSEKSITYKVTENSGTSTLYSVMYTGENGITITEGGLTEKAWTKTINNLKSGTFISFTLECINRNGSYKISVFKGSVLLLEDTMEGQYSPLTWNGTIP